MINPLLLGFSQFLFMVYVSVGLAFSGIVGAEMVEQKYATLPFLFATATTMLVAIFLEKLAKRLGYKRLFACGALVGIVAGFVGGMAIVEESFVLFCLSAALAGVFQGSALYYRYAAADSVVMEKKSSAIAWVLSGGILAAVLGPIFASQSVNALQNIPYAGAFYASSMVAILVLPLVFFLKPISEPSVVHGDEPQASFPLGELFKIPLARRAMILSVGGYAVMAFMMVASPLAVKGCGFHLDDAASVIQWHLIGMFAPSLITGKLIQKWGVTSIANMGIGLMVLAGIIAVNSETLPAFHFALFFVGIGWNFMFMSGSTLIAKVNEPEIRTKLQATNETLTYGLMAISTGISGAIFQWGGWQYVSVFAFIMLAVVSVGLIVVSILGRELKVDVVR